MKEKIIIFPLQRFQKSYFTAPQKSPKNLPFFQAFFPLWSNIIKATTWQLRIEPLKEGEIERERKEKGKLPQSELEGNQI